MSHILKGLKGEQWEEALLITYPGRGMPRVVDEPDNLFLILANRKPDLPFSGIESIRDFLREEYNLNTSARSVRTALKFQTNEENARLINRIVDQHKAAPFPETVSVLALLKNELSWLQNPMAKFRVIAEALDRIGYVRRRVSHGVIWEK